MVPSCEHIPLEFGMGISQWSATIQFSAAHSSKAVMAPLEISFWRYFVFSQMLPEIDGIEATTTITVEKAKNFNFNIFQIVRFEIFF